MANNDKVKHRLILTISPYSQEERLICTNCHSEFIEKYFRLSVGTNAQYCPVCGVKVEDNCNGWYEIAEKGE